MDNHENDWEIERIVAEPTGEGTTSEEYAYLINRYTCEVKKIKVQHLKEEE